MSTATGQAASIRFRAGIGGEPVLVETSASDSYFFKPTRWGATLIGSPAHPVAGDHARLKVQVGVGCCAEVRSSAATVARRGNHRPVWGEGPVGSTLSLLARVGSDGMLAWRPEPGVAADACYHRAESTVELAGNARLLWRDEFILDRRRASTPGTWNSRLRVTRDGWPVVCTEQAVGPGSPLWESPAVLEGAKALSLMVVVDPGHPPEGWCTARATEGSATGVAMPLAGPGVQIVAWGDDLFDCRMAIEAMVHICGTPGWAAERWRNGRALDVVG